MILTDGVHLVSTDGEEELHRFAGRIGLRKKWFQGDNGHPHYDLTTNRMANKAVDAGAYLTTARELIRRGKGEGK